MPSVRNKDTLYFVFYEGPKKPVYKSVHLHMPLQKNVVDAISDNLKEYFDNLLTNGVKFQDLPGILSSSKQKILQIEKEQVEKTWKEFSSWIKELPYCEYFISSKYTGSIETNYGIREEDDTIYYIKVHDIRFDNTVLLDIVEYESGYDIM